MQREFAPGHVNALLLGAVVLAFRCLDDGSTRRAGALLGTAALFKPPWIIFALCTLIMPLQRRTAAWALGTLAAGLMMPALRYGLHGTWALAQAMNEQLAKSTGRLLAHAANASLPGLAAKLLPISTRAAIVAPTCLAIVAAVVAAVVWARHRSRHVDAVAPLACMVHPSWEATPAVVEPWSLLAIVAPAAILLSPQAWDYTAFIAIPTWAFVVGQWKTLAPWKRVAVGVASFLIALDPKVLAGTPARYEAIMRWSPNTWSLLVLAAVGVTSTQHRGLSGGQPRPRTIPRAQASA